MYYDGMKLDAIKLSNPYLELPELCYTRVKPTPLKKPFLIHVNKSVAQDLDIDEEELQSDHFVDFINGALELQGSDSFAMCYAGHQFGFYVPRLGDGRAINIGTIGRQHLQLKGAGLTRYSRSGDGRAVAHVASDTVNTVFMFSEHNSGATGDVTV